ncbi:MAG: FAD-dependent oxidoreductase [Halobacteriovoraceae bacterium]|nr:FAD-dependent oxidoreductase [Halobacteriovoraceae bacterium]
MKKVIPKVLILLIIIGLFIAAKKFGLQDYLSLEYLKENIDQFKLLYTENPTRTISIFMGVYILSTALSIPGATILTLGAGALFGLGMGLLLVSFASTIGATLAFLASRFILRDYVQEKFGERLKSINDGVKREGAFYLFTLRLVPLFPFFVINLVMGLTPINVFTYFIVSQVGMLLGTAVYVNAGVQLSQISNVGDIFSLKLLLSFTALGVLPILGKKIISIIKTRKVYKKYKRPKSYDYNMVAIGGGAAGLVNAYISTAVNDKDALIEKQKMGGDCLNTGCVPSKAIIKTAKVVHSINNSKKYGIKQATCEFDLKEVMGRVHKVIDAIEPHDSIERYTKLGVDCLTGEAKILSPWEVEINGEVITTKNITIATGASPFVPPIEGIKNVPFLTSENLWQLEELPEKMIILGGGPIGLEMAQSFHRLGSQVSLVEMGSRILSVEDEDVSEYLLKKLRDEGVDVFLNHKAVSITETHLTVETDKGREEIPFDKILVAVGRKANIKGFGLENLEVQFRKNGTIETNEYLQTIYPNIFACGDVTGPYQLTHTAAHQAWFCAVNGLFGRFKKFKVDYSVIPWATYTDPEVATVGKNESALKAAGIEYDVTKYGIDDLDRAIADSSDYGFVKVMTTKGSDKILGATVVGVNGSDLILEFIAAMKHGFGLNAILGTIHPYPTMGEANKYAAGMWKKARKPEGVLKLLRKFHSWERKGTPESQNSLNKIDA